MWIDQFHVSVTVLIYGMAWRSWLVAHSRDIGGTSGQKNSDGKPNFSERFQACID